VRLYDATTGKEAVAIKGPASLGFVIFSPDGTRIAGKCKGDGTLRVYDALTGKEALVLKDMDDRFVVSHSPAFSSDGASIAAWVRGGLKLCEARTGREEIVIKGLVFTRRIVFSPDGTRIYGSAIRDGVLKVCNARTGQEVLSLKVPAWNGNTNFAAADPVVSPDGARVAVMGGDGLLRVFDTYTGQEALSLRGVDRNSRAVFSPDGARIAATGADGLVRVYDVRATQESLFIKDRYLDTPQFSPDGNRITAPSLGLIPGGDGVARVYDVHTGLEVLALRGPASRSFSPVLSPDGSRIAVYAAHFKDGDGTVRIYDARTGREPMVIRGPTRLYSAKFSPDGARVAATSADGVLRVYDSLTGKESLSLKLDYAEFSPDSTKIVGTRTDGLVRLYDSSTGREALTFKGRGGIAGPPFSPDGNRIAIVSADRLVRIYDGRTGEELFILKGSETDDTPVFNQDGSRIVTAGIDGVVRVYGMQAGQEILALKGGVRLNFPRFSPDGTRIAAYSLHGDHSVRLFDARTGQETLTLQGPGQRAGIPVFSPDGTRIATDGREGLLIWEALPSLEDLRTLRQRRLMLGISEWHLAEGEKALSERHWFTAEFHLNRLCSVKPDIGHHRFKRAQALMGLGRNAAGRREFEKALALKETLSEVEKAHARAELGQWKEAADEFAKLVVAKGSDRQNKPLDALFDADKLSAAKEAWSAFGLVQLQLGDHVGYSKTCASMLEYFGRKARTLLRDNSVTWVCVRAPGAVSDMAPVLDRARQAVKQQPSSWQELSILGAGLYRTQRYEEAIAELTKAIRLRRRGESPRDFLFLAMADHQLGRVTDAHTQMEKARQVHAEQPQVSWIDRLEWQLLSQEAELLLKKSSPKSKK
jgi:WD40 repeat protein/Flp pilus assembly protein TadD